MFAFVRTILFTVFFYGGSALFVPLVGLSGMLSASALKSGCRLWARWHRVCARLFLGISIRVEGDLPAGGHFFVMKHESMFEAIDTLAFFHRPMVVQKKELLDIPVWGWVARRHGVIAIDRNAGAAAVRHMIQASKASLAEGRPIVLFPEGTRIAPGEAPPLKAGLSALYQMLKVPVIPIAVDAGRFVRRNHFAKQPGVVTYRIGAPIPPGLGREDMEARVHAAINALNSDAIS
jgi:1-acyl-sn-glycerol-3-phosphate acyltransferase